MQRKLADIVCKFLVLFVIAVPPNYVWELGQSPLYFPANRIDDLLGHCFAASLGDGILVGIVYLIGLLWFAERDWYVRMSALRYTGMLATGLVIGLLVEWAALQTGRWRYADGMPLVPGLRVGLVPVIQMLVLPPMVFLLARAWASRLRQR